MKVGHENVSFVYNYVLTAFWLVVAGVVLHCILG